MSQAEYEAEGAGNLREYLAAFRRRRFILIATVLAVVAGAVAASWRMTPIFEGTARLEVQPVSTLSEEAQFVEALLDRSRGLQTQVELIRSDPVLEKAAEDLGLPSTEELASSMEVELVGDTTIVEIRVEHPVPEEAAAWANAVADAYLQYRREQAIEQIELAGEEIGRRIEVIRAEIAEKDPVLADLGGAAAQARAERDRLQAELDTAEAEMNAAQAQPTPQPPSRFRLNQMEEMRLRIAELDRQIEDYESGGAGPRAERDGLVAKMGALEAQRQELPSRDLLQRGGGQVITPAVAADTPVRPNMARNALLALVLGLALGVGLVFLAETLDDRIHHPEEVEERVGAPILGYVPYIKEQSGEPGPFVAALEDPHSGVAESFRTLRTNLKFVSLQQSVRSVLVTSALAGEGKSTVAANLAVVSAQGGTRTILISADLRKPAVHRPLGLSNDIGILNALEPSFPLEGALQTNSVENFRLLASGGSPPYPAEILASTRFAEMMLEVVQAADLAIYDSPPVLGIADASSLASRVDGVLLVVDPHEVTRRSLTHAADQIRKAGGTILGVVMNAVEPDEGYGYYYQYYYYAYSGDGKRPPKVVVPGEPTGEAAEEEARS